ncbi:hypothetical protein EDB92DRAFT_437514 [Lactarius akahatsu]|uniref:Uncharacterized protein n=1 Tax=Lactarius akahatsu TaxID=416441 RepID=A0AAD4QEM4_9AGAM|nr:hypothetical protein EDB92DRAFT_437514 [Lactarius akahatsu]
MSEAHRVATPTRSWRRTVADALALAQSAVELDTANTDPSGALFAYTKSVRRLRTIRARLERHGAHVEARQLAAICDGYTERMRQLSVTCTVPPPPYEYQPSQSPFGSERSVFADAGVRVPYGCPARVHGGT